MKDYYKILAISQSASLIEIKKAYRKLALIYHPDKNKSMNAVPKFIEITEAYEVLSNIEKRKLFDFYYKQQFQKDNSIKNVEVNYNNSKTEWQKYAETKAKEYSEVNFDEFSNRLFSEIKVGVKYTPNVILILFISFGVAGLLFKALPLAISDKNAPDGLIPILLVAILGWSYFVYKYFTSSKDKYLNERKDKIQ